MAHDADTYCMNKQQVIAEMDRKRIGPGSRCSFVHGALPGSPSCTSPAVVVVIEHRVTKRHPPKDVVLVACSHHRGVFWDEPGFTVFSFDHLNFLSDEDQVV